MNGYETYEAREARSPTRRVCDPRDSRNDAAIIGARGYHSFSLEEVATGARVSKATLKWEGVEGVTVHDATFAVITKPCLTCPTTRNDDGGYWQHAPQHAPAIRGVAGTKQTNEIKSQV